MIKLTTAGESHGKMLVGILEGLPSNLPVNIEEIDGQLALRQSGYGRGGRQKIGARIWRRRERTLRKKLSPASARDTPI